jgi:hypothetical protein
MGNVDRWALAQEARTLQEAHELLGRLQPAPDSEQSVLLDYYQRSAVVYSHVAEVDRGHHHEALYWANRERAKADQLSNSHSKAAKA